MKITKKLKDNKGASAITLAIFAVILISIFIVMSMNQIGNQMKSTRKRNENIELKYVAEAGTEQIISDIYNQIDTKTKEEIKKFEDTNNAIIQEDAIGNINLNIDYYKSNGGNNYLISHLNDAANMYLQVSNKIRNTNSQLADSILENIYNPIVKNIYDINGKSLTLIGWAKEAQDGLEEAQNLLINTIGFNDNTQVTPEYNGNNENFPSIAPNKTGIKQYIETIRPSIGDEYKIKFEKAEYALNLSLYTVTHMKESHAITNTVELTTLLSHYLELNIKRTLESAKQEVDNYNHELAEEIARQLTSEVSNIQIKISQLINNQIDEKIVVESINSLIDRITDMQETLLKNNIQSGIDLLEKAKRQLIEAKCRLGNVNMGGNEVTPEDPTDPSEVKVIEIPIEIKKNDYEKEDKDITQVGENTFYELNEDISFILRIELKLIRKADGNNRNIYTIITDNPYPYKDANIDIISKYNEDFKDDYNMKSTIRFKIKDVKKSTRATQYEVLQWNN